MTRACPICNEAKDLKKIYTNAFRQPDQYNLPREVPILECQHCGFIYGDVPDQATYDEYYTKYFYSSTGEKGYKRFVDEASAIDNSMTIDKEDSILDIGSDNGYLENVLFERGFTNVKTLDPRCDADYQGTIFKHNVKDKFDFIVLSHTLEHVVDVRGAVKAIKKLLNPGGCLFVALPDVSKYYGVMKELSMELSQKHIGCFNQTHLDALFVGWDKVDSGSYVFDLAPAYSCPCIWTIYRVPSLYSDSIHDFIEWHKDEMARAREWLEAIDSPIIVWGYGDLAANILAHADVEVAQIVDSVQAGLTVDGMPICLEPTMDYPIVIISSRHAEEIRKQIIDRGLKNKVYVYGEGSK
jgi:YgiT-type zinc finger domain-containing protein